MKKIVALLLVLCMTFAFVGCMSNQPDDEVSPEQAYKDFMKDFNSQSAVALNARVEYSYDGKKMLLADVKNNCDDTISEMVVSFATWNEDGVFEVIKSENLPYNTYDVFEVTLDGVTVNQAQTWVADKGLVLAETSYDIKYAEAIVCSCKIGDTEYTNPLYDAWKEQYIGVSLADFIKAEKDAASSTGNQQLTREERYPDFAKKLEVQEVQACNVKFDAELENNDKMLLADIKNNLTETIKDISVCFVAWDAEGNPVMIKSKSGTSNDAYVKLVGYGDITLEAGQSWLADNGVDVTGYNVLNEDIATVKAIVVSYTKADGTEWKNPLYSEWFEFFGGNKLESYMTSGETSGTEETPVVEEAPASADTTAA